MCKSCYSDPAWDEIRYRRQGMVDVDDFDEEPRYRKPGTGTRWAYKKKKARGAKRGCPENNGKGHVWVWTSEREVTDIFYKHFGFHKKESKICCGCGYRAKSRETEEYMRRKERAWRKLTGGEFDVPRGEPIERYRWRGKRFWAFEWEMDDPAYKAKYDEWHERQRRLWLSNMRLYDYPRY